MTDAFLKGLCSIICKFCIVLAIHLSIPGLLFAMPTPQIFVLHSYTHEYPWTQYQHEGFIQTLAAESQVEPIVSTEYLDTKRRAYDEAYANEFARHLRIKYSDYKPTSIYVTDDNALLFTRDYLSRIFPGTPVFFSGVNDYNILDSLDSSLFTGVFEQKEVGPNLDWLLHMDKDANNLIFIGDGSNTYQAIEREASKALEQYPIRATFIAEKRLDKALALLGDLPGNYLFLTTLGGMTDANGNVLSLRETMRSLAHTGRIVISMEDVYIIEGVLGGYVTSGQKQGMNAAQLVVAYMRGKAIADLPPILESPNTFIFDDRVIRQHGLELPDDLLAKSILLNPRMGIYRQYRTVILGSLIGLAVLLFLVIVGSLLFVAHKNRELNFARKSAESANTRFNEIAEQSRTVYWEINADGLYTRISDVSEALIGYLPEDIIGKKYIYDFHPTKGLEAFKKMICKTLRRKEPFRDIESIIQTRNGGMIWVSVNGIPFLDRNGHLEGYRGSSVDITSRKQVEEELRDSEEKLHAAIDKSPFPIAFVDTKDEKILYWSQSAIETFGHNPKNISEWYELAYPDPLYRQQVINRWKPLLKMAIESENAVNTGEYQIVCKDGKIKVCEIYAQFIPGNLIVTLNDITDRKIAEKSIQESEALFLTAFQDSPAAAAIADLADNRLVRVNRAWQEMNGYSNSEAIGHTPFELNLWVDPYQRKRLVDRIRSQGKAHEEIQLRRKSGEIFHALISASIVTIRKQDYLLSMGQDITERKKAELLLKESRERFKELAELLPETIFELAIDGTVTFVNRNAYDHFRYTEEDFRQGLNAFDMIAPEDRSRAMKNMKQIQSGENLGLTQYQALRKDGTTFPTLFHSTPITRDGNSVGIRGFIIDISEKKKLEDQLLHAQKMESIGTLAGGIAHDFNNILSSIIGFTELALEEAEKDSPIEEDLREVYAAGNRAKELVKQILAFARKTEEEAKPVKLKAIAEEITRLLRSSIPTSIEIITKFDSTGLIMGNPTQLHQVIMNLCTNAAHAMEERGGTLTISTKDVDFDQTPLTGHPKSHEKRYVRFQVSDTGTGIPPGVVDSIFEPYFTTKKTGEGTGMGLAMVQGIVESYGGNITVHSTLGEGSTFTIHLPLTAQSETQRQHEPETLPTGTERILLVDDEAPIVKMSSLMLEGLGYQVTARYSSTDALELFKARPADFDLVISDMTMPDMTGDVLAIEMMRIRSDIPVILCTGYSKRISDESVYEIGIKALVNKPFVRADLAWAIRNVLDESLVA